jgi:hypothetical protein
LKGKPRLWFGATSSCLPIFHLLQNIYNLINPLTPPKSNPIQVRIRLFGTSRKGVGMYVETSSLVKLQVVRLTVVKKSRRFFIKKRLPGVGSEPRSSQFHLFSHFHHFTAEPQRLPRKNK